MSRAAGGAVARRLAPSRQCALSVAQILAHRHELDRHTAVERMLDRLLADIPEGAVQPLAGQRRHQLRRAEAIRTGFRFTPFEQRATDTAPGAVRAHEEGADLGRLARRIEQGRFATS